MYSRTFLLSALLLVTATLLIPIFMANDVLSANGKATLLMTEEKGAYRVDISSLPNRPVVNNTHLSLLVMSTADSTPITRAEVSVSAVGPVGSIDILAHDALNDVVPQYFETTLPFNVEGVWEVTINLSSDLGEESISILLDVTTGSPVNWILMTAIVVAILAGGIFTWDKVSGRKRSVKQKRTKR